MGKLRKEFKNGFTTVSNDMYRDQRLSISERGLLGTMLSLPETWNFSIKGLVSIVPDGERVIRSRLRKLEECGYLKREKIIGDHGRIVDWDYTFSDSPIFLEEGEQLKIERERKKTEKILNGQKKENDAESSPVGQNSQVEESSPVGRFAHVEDAVVENAVVQDAVVQNDHTYKYTKQSNNKRLNTIQSRINEESSNEFNSREAEIDPNTMVENTQKEDMPKEVDASHSQVNENVMDEKSFKDPSEQNHQNEEPKKKKTKKKYVADSYLDVIKSVSEDRNVQNSFYRFLVIRETRYHLTVDELTIRNFITQLHTFSSRIVNGKNVVLDEAMQTILANAIASESKKIWELDVKTMNQIVEKATENKPLWSHINPNVRVLTPEEAAIREKEIDELYEQMTRELDAEYAKRKEEQKNGNNAFITNYQSVWG